MCNHVVNRRNYQSIILCWIIMRMRTRAIFFSISCLNSLLRCLDIGGGRCYIRRPGKNNRCVSCVNVTTPQRLVAKNQEIFREISTIARTAIIDSLQSIIFYDEFVVEFSSTKMLKHRIIIFFN